MVRAFDTQLASLLTITKQWATTGPRTTSDAVWRPTAPHTIVEGDLVIDGNLVVATGQSDGGALIVRGNVTCRNLVVGTGFAFACTGAVRVTEVILATAADSTTWIAGSVQAALIVSGANAWVSVYDEKACNVESIFGYMMFGRTPLRRAKPLDLREILIDSAIDWREWNRLSPVDQAEEDARDYLSCNDSNARVCLSRGETILRAAANAVGSVATGENKARATAKPKANKKPSAKANVKTKAAPRVKPKAKPKAKRSR